MVEQSGQTLRVAPGVEWPQLQQLSLCWTHMQYLDLSNMDNVDLSLILEILAWDRHEEDDQPVNIVALPANVSQLLEWAHVWQLQECCLRSEITGQTLLRTMLQTKNLHNFCIDSKHLVPLITPSTITDFFHHGSFQRTESTPSNLMLRYMGFWSDPQLQAFLYNSLLFEDVAAIMKARPIQLGPSKPLPAEMVCGVLQLTGGVGLRALIRHRHGMVYESVVPDSILARLHISADLHSGLDLWSQRFHTRASSASTVHVHPFARMWHNLITAQRVEELEGMEEEELWNRVFHESSALSSNTAWQNFSHAAARLLFDLKRLSRDVAILSFVGEEHHFLMREADRVEELWEVLGVSLKERLRTSPGTSLSVLLACFESADRLRVIVRLLVREMQTRRVERAAFMNAFLSPSQALSTVEARWQFAVQQAHRARLQWYQQPRWRRGFYRLWTPTLLSLKEGFEALLYGSATHERDLHLACRRNLIPPLLRDHAAFRHSLVNEEEGAWKQMYFREYYERLARLQGQHAAGLMSLGGV